MVQWLGLGAFTAWVQSLVMELRSCKLSGTAPPKKKKKKKKFFYIPLPQDEVQNLQCAIYGIYQELPTYHPFFSSFIPTKSSLRFGYNVI